MNANNSTSNDGYIFQFNPADSLSNSRLRHECQDGPDYWTALLSVFLVACMLAALMICTTQVGDWQHVKSAGAQPAVAVDGFQVSGQHTF